MKKAALIIVVICVQKPLSCGFKRYQSLLAILVKFLKATLAAIGTPTLRLVTTIRFWVCFQPPTPKA